MAYAGMKFVASVSTYCDMHEILLVSGWSDFMLFSGTDLVFTGH